MEDGEEELVGAGREDALDSRACAEVVAPVSQIERRKESGWSPEVVED